jgi:hypothetical protein
MTKCHYINALGVGMVLIPECWGATISGDLAHCTCGNLDPETVAEYEREQRREAERKPKEIDGNNGTQRTTTPDGQTHMKIMTREQITQAAIGYRKQVTIWRGRKEAHYANRDFIAGANHRQPEIDTLTADVERYKLDLEESKQREQIAQGIIREKREDIERIKRAEI